MALLFLCLMLIICSCSTTKKSVVESESIRNDSVIIEYVTETKYVKDTVLINIPEFSAERTTADSCSHLSNKYAESNAKINPDGTLYHDLIMLPQTIPKAVDVPVTVTSTSKNKSSSLNSLKKTVKTVVKPIPLSIRIWAACGKLLATLLILLVIYKIFKRRR